jgi:tetratricopeptide (TPR) repeat protein
MTAFGALKLWHILRRPNVGIQNLVLKSGGRVRGSGWVFTAFAILWLSFTAHSAFVQWHRARGLQYLSMTESSRVDLTSGEFLRKQYSPRHYHAAREALRHLSLAEGWGIVDLVDINLGLSWADVLQSDLDAAEAHARRAVTLAPDQQPLTLQNLVYVLVAEHRIPTAIETMRRKFEVEEPSAADHFQLGWLLSEAGRLEDAAGEYETLVAMAPESAEARNGLGGILRRLGRYTEALEQLQAALQISPGDAETHVELGMTHLGMGARVDALRSLKQAVDLEPEIPDSAARKLIDRLEGSGTEAPPLPPK